MLTKMNTGIHKCERRTKMGKKKKERDSYWDIDDQQAAADAFFEFESGNGKLNVKEDDIDANGIAGPLADLIASDLACGKQDKDEEDSYTNANNYDDPNEPDVIDYDSLEFDLGGSDNGIISSTDEGITINPIAKDVLPNTPVTLPDFREISASVFEPIGRVVVNDFIAPTAFAYGYEMECENLEK